MRRRKVISTLGLAVGIGLPGCASLGSVDDIPSVEQSEIRAGDRQCTEADEDSATITFGDGDRRIDVAGRYGVRKISYKLDVTVRTDVANADRDDAVEIRIDQYAASSANESVPDCRGVVDYEATVALSRAPNAVVVRHVKEDEDRAYPETVATSAP